MRSKKIATIFIILLIIGYSLFCVVSSIISVHFFILSLLLCALLTFFSFELIESSNTSREINTSFSEVISSISPTRIQVFENSSDWADAMDSLVRKGNHSVDTASLDLATRSKGTADRNKVWNHIDNCCKNPNIKFRHIMRIRKNNFENLLERMQAGTEKNNTFFALYDLPQVLSFPTFGIIDNRYVSTRSPYAEGETPHYMIIENEEIVRFFSRYYTDLWRNGTLVKSTVQLEDLLRRYKDSFSETEYEKLLGVIQEIERQGIVSDV